MPDDDLLRPPTTDLTVAASLDDALAELDEVDLLVLDAGTAALLADAGIALPDGLDEVWPDRPDEVADLVRPAAEPSDVRVVGVTTASSTDELRRLGARVGRLGIGLKGVVVALSQTGQDGGVAALAEGLVLGGHQPALRRKGEAAPGAEPAALTVVVEAGADAAVQAAGALVAARASLVARNLANTPSNVKNPQWMVERARAVATAHGLSMSVIEEDELASRGFGGLTAVGGGSVTPPRLVELGYEPARAGRGRRATTPQHVVLVGKGITFDTGGIDVKPALGMASMRTDMSGSAVVLAVIAAVAELELPVRVTALLPLAENAFGESSYRPGDVIAPFGGRRTVEVTNTDAEGRLVLADALAYADDHLDPDLLVDVATLTGAARVALARSMAAIFSNDDEVAVSLTTAAARAGEPVWRLPLYADYRELLDSAVADLDNAPGKAGAVTAALFLQEFVGERRWAHLDIAGPGRSDDDTGLLSKGATGYGARALLTWLGDLG